MRLVKAVKTGAPMATPMAYKLTNNPADGILMFKSEATVGKRPTITNSVVPIPKALMVKANKAAGIFLVVLLAVAVGAYAVDFIFVLLKINSTKFRRPAFADDEVHQHFSVR